MVTTNKQTYTADVFTFFRNSSSFISGISTGIACSSSMYSTYREQIQLNFCENRERDLPGHIAGLCALNPGDMDVIIGGIEG